MHKNNERTRITTLNNFLFAGTGSIIPQLQNTKLLGQYLHDTSNGLVKGNYISKCIQIQLQRQA